MRHSEKDQSVYLPVLTNPPKRSENMKEVTIWSDFSDSSLK